MDEQPVGLMTGILDEDHYEFAELSPEEVKKLQDSEGQLGDAQGKKTILLAYEKR